MIKRKLLQPIQYKPSTKGSCFICKTSARTILEKPAQEVSINANNKVSILGSKIPTNAIIKQTLGIP